MKDPNIKVEIKHSESKTAWNVIGKMAGGKYKIARIPYYVQEGNKYEIMNTSNKNEALEHAKFICHCFNNSDKIV